MVVTIILSTPPPPPIKSSCHNQIQFKSPTAAPLSFLVRTELSAPDIELFTLLLAAKSRVRTSVRGSAAVLRSEGSGGAAVPPMQHCDAVTLMGGETLQRWLQLRELLKVSDYLKSHFPSVLPGSLSRIERGRRYQCGHHTLCRSSHMETPQEELRGKHLRRAPALMFLP